MKNVRRDHLIRCREFTTSGSRQGHKASIVTNPHFLVVPARAKSHELGRILAMGAGAGNFNYGQLRREPRGAGGIAQTLRHAACGNFADRAALLADQKRHHRALIVVVPAGQERITAFDTVN